MPYKLERDQRIYSKGYYAGYRRATIDHLGCKCTECDENRASRLEIHHPDPLDRVARTLKDLKDLSKLRLRCVVHHPDRQSR